ncbi:MAG TPA: heparan-alpha-glucosaminide N-acetyltransferase domain-containing protein [Chitinophagaceae bacterium]|nr:heparan-alpha-glucosaminide N-acetyltransferase domain-containing protein [Chitinophagaceae bacterium]
MKERYYSLDVFRGATVALMILVNNPGSWAHIYSPLKHAPWHGLTPTDLVFPFFLFAVGNAMAFVMPRLEAAGNAVFWKKVLKRTALIFLIGLFLNWWPFARWQDAQIVFNGWTWINSSGDVSGVRILGVLQRIALCYFFASVIVYYLKTRGAFLLGLILLLLYWLYCVWANPEDPYSLAGWAGTGIDKAILAEVHMYKGEGIAFEPEGLMSTIPAIVQVIFGYLVGDYILKRTKLASEAEKSDTNSANNSLFQILTGLFIAAMAFLFAGYAWGLSFPINKKIWTSSYVVLTTGMAIAILATLIYAIEIKKLRGWWTRFFDVFGKNALFVFALSAFLPKGLRLIRIPNGVNHKGIQQYVSPWNWLYEKAYKFVPGAPEIGSLLFALTVILFMWAICYWMDKRRIYIKV